MYTFFPELLTKYTAPNDTDTQDQVLSRVSDYCGKKVTNYTTDTHVEPLTWSFYHAFFFSFTVCSTVGEICRFSDFFDWFHMKCLTLLNTSFFWSLLQATEIYHRRIRLGAYSWYFMHWSAFQSMDSFSPISATSSEKYFYQPTIDIKNTEQLRPKTMFHNDWVWLRKLFCIWSLASSYSSSCRRWYFRTSRIGHIPSRCIILSLHFQLLVNKRFVSLN